FPTANLNARRIASALEAPGCHRRTILEASETNIDRLGDLVTGDQIDRQSPFAITRGNKFEKVVTDHGMATVLSLAREHLGLEIPEARQKDLSAPSVRSEFPDTPSGRMNERRGLLTRQYVEQMLTNPEFAINLLRHAMTTLNFGGVMAYLEQDVLAFTIRGRIHVVEIKSFPQIDGRADPTKASATVRQAAVYVLSLQELARSVGASPDVVDTNVMIILPENLSFSATASVVDTSVQVRRLRRQLNEVPHTARILAGLPPGSCLPPLPRSNSSEEIAPSRAAAREALSALPCRFGDGCTSCPLFRFCRQEAAGQRLVARLGTQVAGVCGSVTTVDAALDLAAGRRNPADPGEAAAAEQLARSAAVLASIDGGRAA
ncbi:MAG: hypothetical protein N0E54_17280, partial [Candidatus Thiodiazotropha taylori]|nr:hypothetical protein [Candidatus Thiodiazotropha endolucinida]MCW4230496.1 hypothetical protein [Candidatus Thiodiazotropha taylori]